MTSKRMLSLLLALVMLLGLIPVSAGAEEEPPEYVAPPLVNINISGAGAADLAGSWASGEFMEEQQAVMDLGLMIDHHSTSMLKTRIMVQAMYLSSDYGIPPAYYFPASDSGSVHEITLYGGDLDPETISITGARLMSGFTKHVYGSGKGKLYWYTAKLFVPNTNAVLGIGVGDDYRTEVPFYHVNGATPVPLMTTLWVEEYEEADDGSLDSVTLRISGIDLPDAADRYTLTWENPEDYENPNKQTADSLTEADECGYRLLTFRFSPSVNGGSLTWAHLLVDDRTVYFFSPWNHLVTNDRELVADADGNYRYRTDYSYGTDEWYNLGGVSVSMGSPYYCLTALPDGIPEVLPAVSLPAAETREAAVAASLTAGSYQGGYLYVAVDDNYAGWISCGAVDAAEFQHVVTLEEMGYHSIYYRLHKKGLIDFSTEPLDIDYNDGQASAPANLGIIDPETGMYLSEGSTGFVLTGSEDKIYRFWAVIPMSGEFALEAVFHTGNIDEPVFTVDLPWSQENWRYQADVARESILDATDVTVRRKAEAGGLPGHGLTKSLDNRETSPLRILQAPLLSFRLELDGEGSTFKAIDPGAPITALFLANTENGRYPEAALEYTDIYGAARTLYLEPSLLDRKYAIAGTVPDDADTLKQLRIALRESDSTLVEERVYDLSDHRVSAEVTVSGFTEEYIGTTFTLYSGSLEKYAVITADNYLGVSFGDLAPDYYSYEITGDSGHILGDTLAIERGAAVTLDSLPALGTYTASADEAVRAAAVLELTAPDGTPVTLRGAVNSTFRQLPIGSTGTARLEFDSAAYPDLRGASPSSREVSISGDEAQSFTWMPFTMRTVRGKVKHPTPRPNYAQHTYVVLTQHITRGGTEELYTLTQRVDSAGNFSFRCYDGFPVDLSFKSIFFGNSSYTVTEDGDQDIGEYTLTANADIVIRVNLTVETPTTRNKKGQTYYTIGDDHMEGSADSGTLVPVKLAIQRTVDGVTDWYYYGPNDGVYETRVMNGQLEILVHPEYSGANMHVYFQNNTVIAGQNMILYNPASPSNPFTHSVYQDSTGDRYVSLKAKQAGGEIRATVVNETAYPSCTGFLVLVNEPLTAENPYPYRTCSFVYGRGELHLPYSGARSNATVFSLMCRESDTEAMANLLRSNVQRVLDFAATRNFTIQVMRNVELPASSYVSLGSYPRDYPDSMYPWDIVGSEVLPAYSFSYYLTMGDTANSVILNGTLTKRLADEENTDLISSLSITTFNGTDTATLTNFIVDGQGVTYAWGSGGVNRPEISVQAVLPLTNNNEVNFTIDLSMFGSAAPLSLHYQDVVPIFTLSVPQQVYLKDVLSAQSLLTSPPEQQAAWTLDLALRAFASDKPEENQITIWDNGVAILTTGVSRGVGSGVITGGDFRKLKVRLTDNLEPGIHVVYATRLYTYENEAGELVQETISTEPRAFTLLAGDGTSQVYVSHLEWTHWNHRINWNEPDRMYFENLNDLAGETVWIWPQKKHTFRFRVNNATSKELEKVYFKYNTIAWNSAASIDSLNNITAVTWSYPVIKSEECSLVYDNLAGNYSVWELKDLYPGYISHFDFEFSYKPAIVNAMKGMSEEERRQAELQLYYESNGLGTVPDDTELVAALAEATPAQIRESLSENAELLPAALQDLDMQYTENGSSCVARLAAPTADVREYSITMSKGSGTVNVWDAWIQMTEEREHGSIEPDERPEDGWTVTWGELDGMQGTTLIRMAVKKEQDAAGLWHLTMHRRVYVTASVADALEDGATLAEATLMRDLQDEGDPPDHWIKKTYDVTSNLVTVTDMGQDVYVAAVKDAEYYITKSRDIAEEAGEKAKFIPEKVGTVMNVLGVVDTAVAIYKGPSGADPNGLRALLSNVKDENFRRSIETQIRDYEDLRESIYIQDMQMKSLGTTAGFVANASVFTKIAVFLGGLGNGYLSDKAKEYNREVYNTTLMDIERQLRVKQ